MNVFDSTLISIVTLPTNKGNISSENRNTVVGSKVYDHKSIVRKGPSRRPSYRLESVCGMIKMP